MLVQPLQQLVAEGLHVGGGGIRFSLRHIPDAGDDGAHGRVRQGEPSAAWALLSPVPANSSLTLFHALTARARRSPAK